MAKEKILKEKWIIGVGGSIMDAVRSTCEEDTEDDIKQTLGFFLRIRN